MTTPPLYGKPESPNYCHSSKMALVMYSRYNLCVCKFQLFIFFLELLHVYFIIDATFAITFTFEHFDVFDFVMFIKFQR